MARKLSKRMGAELRAGKQEAGRQSEADWSFRVLGPIPRIAPYAKGFRGRLYVPEDVKAWRKRIAKAFLRSGGVPPLGGSTVLAEYSYTMADSHADLDSITHSAQDALSKDALHIVDKEWWGVYRRVGVAPSKAKESIYIRVRYIPEGKIDAYVATSCWAGMPSGTISPSVPAAR